MTTTEEVIRLARGAGFQTGMMTHVANPWPIVQPCVGTNCFVELTRLIELVKAEENEAIIAAANALENIASTSSSTRIRRVANDALTAIRARRKACCEKS